MIILVPTEANVRLLFISDMSASGMDHSERIYSGRIVVLVSS